METIIWDEKLLSVGVMQFDNEHKFLIKYLNELNDAIKIGSSQTIMEEILVKIMHYTKSHFAHEEKYMTRYNYPGYEAHRQEHAMLTEQVNDFYTRFTEKKSLIFLGVNTFSLWMANQAYTGNGYEI
ncbi:MAG: hemerythrin family protein [Leptospiraceae bacterium]|nr:hemerythrin family protein [Leptospiraceae bacterium]